MTKRDVRSSIETVGREWSPWLRKVRLRVLAAVTGVGLAAFALVGWVSLPVLPVVGFAVAAVVVAVNTIGGKVSHATCMQCGESLVGQKPGVYGVACPHCGAINEHARDTLA